MLANERGTLARDLSGTRLGKRQHLPAEIHGNNLATARIVMEVLPRSNRNLQYSA